MGGVGVTWIAIGTFVVGLVVGGIGGVYFLKNKMMNMKMSDTDIASMAKSMGMNLNQKQMQQIQHRMKNIDPKMSGGKGGQGGTGKKRR